MEKRGEISFSSYNEYNIMEGDEQIVEHATNYYKISLARMTNLISR